MSGPDPVRDCPHGHLKGKCDTCSLIEAEKRIAALEAELDSYESDYTICDCCECLTPDPVDADGHTQCKSCTQIAALEAEVADWKKKAEDWGNQSDDANRKLIIALRENAALKETQRWIPVGERLPTKRGRYDSIWVNTGGNRFRVIDTGFTSYFLSREFCTIEYWRECEPLPAPPEEKGK